MTPFPSKCVLDAGVAVKLFIVEPLSEIATALFTQLKNTPPIGLYVPDLFFVECTNVLWKQTRRGGYPSDKAKQSVNYLEVLPFHVTPTKELIQEAFEIGLSYGVTAYDASYVALSKQLQVPMITADEKLVRLLANSPHNVQWLGDFSVP